jgi:hypothetical protein
MYGIYGKTLTQFMQHSVSFVNLQFKIHMREIYLSMVKLRGKGHSYVINNDLRQAFINIQC